MSIILNDNLDTQFNKPLDTRFGPYPNVATALVQVPLYRRSIGLTIGINLSNVEEYWFKDGLQDSDLVAKFESIPYPVRSVNSQTGDVVLTTTGIAQGTNEYFTAAKVRAVVLTGLSLVANAVISATDSVLVAFGKLQAQITTNANATSIALGLKQDTLVSGTNIKTINDTSVLGSGNIVTSVQLSFRHDFESPYDYLGKAVSGSSESSNVWTITRLTISSNGSSIIQSATNVAWTNRYSVIYT